MIIQQTDEISGTVERVIFYSEENGFSVFTLTIGKNSTTTVRGHFPSVIPGERIHITGIWVTHPQFGKQFEAKECTTQLPATISGLKKYLGSGLIKGIGPVYAEKLVKQFGEQVLEIIDKKPEQLKSVPGIGAKRAEQIIISWQSQKEIANIMVFLQEKNISAIYSAKIYKKYGKESIAILKENPYRLAQDIWGIGFAVADKIAQNMGISANSIKRIKAGILHTIVHTTGLGNLYIELSQLKQKTAQLLDQEQNDLDHILTNALHDLYNSNQIRLITHNATHFVTMPSHYASEKGIALKLSKLLAYPGGITIDSNAAYRYLQGSTTKIELNELQQKGILACLNHKVTIITGGPGTGKTTLIKTLLTVLDMNKCRYRLAAPTGRAAKRITEKTGRVALTIHRLLEYDVSSYRFLKNEQNSLDLDFLIVDEVSMIDIFLAYALVKSVPLNAHIVFIGDINQLPSVGAGNFLKDLLTSAVIPAVQLTQIFRQAQNSLIVANAYRVNQGEFPTTSVLDAPDTKRDFVFIKENDPAQVSKHLKFIFNNTIKRFGLRASQATVLVPMNRGIVGTHTINDQLQTIINPKKELEQKQIFYRGTTFKVGDPVMQLRNNYDKLVFNGDIGTIDDIDHDEKVIHVTVMSTKITYDFTELDELALAYAITIHKSQGSEYPAVIIPIFMQHFTLLQRNLLYTAITRAKQLCILIGQSKAIAMAIKNNKGLERTTFLSNFLTTDLHCR